jgi:hypothetical protein
MRGLPLLPPRVLSLCLFRGGRPIPQGVNAESDAPLPVGGEAGRVRRATWSRGVFVATLVLIGVVAGVVGAILVILMAKGPASWTADDARRLDRLASQLAAGVSTDVQELTMSAPHSVPPGQRFAWVERLLDTPAHGVIRISRHPKFLSQENVDTLFSNFAAAGKPLAAEDCANGDHDTIQCHTEGLSLVITRTYIHLEVTLRELLSGGFASPNQWGAVPAEWAPTLSNPPPVEFADIAIKLHALTSNSESSGGQVALKVTRTRTATMPDMARLTTTEVRYFAPGAAGVTPFKSVTYYYVNDTLTEKSQPIYCRFVDECWEETSTGAQVSVDVPGPDGSFPVWGVQNYNGTYLNAWTIVRQVDARTVIARDREGVERTVTLQPGSVSFSGPSLLSVSFGESNLIGDSTVDAREVLTVSSVPVSEMLSPQ